METNKEKYEKLLGMDTPKIDNSRYIAVGVDTNRDNVVSKDKLMGIYLKTLRTIADYLSNTFGPMGSNTKIITGNSSDTISSEYTKDGHNVAKHIKFSNPIEMSIQAELIEITEYVEHEVGDGTTSATILASKIFEYIVAIINSGKYRPYEIIYIFNKIVKMIQDNIISRKKEATIYDIYDICMISTNGNEKISQDILSIYKKYGLDVDIDVTTSTTSYNMIKEYDGMTITEGYSDPAYINNLEKATAEIHNANIYCFIDPIDTIEMISLFEKIIMENIIEPIKAGDACIPTVILSPKMSRDMSSLMQTVIELMNQCQGTQKPPLLIISDISGSDEGIALDIARLCGCKYIRKYIDPKIQEIDVKKGLAASIDNVCSFAGKAELVVANINKTKFVNPAKMMDGDHHSSEYESLLNFLQSELNHAKENGEDSRSIGTIRKRLKSLQANMVEFLVGGISMTDRNSAKDLIIDAVKNCSSAVKNGVGYAANFEGFISSMYIANQLVTRECEEKDLNKYKLEDDIALAIFNAYNETIKLLYSTVENDENSVEKMINDSINMNCPVNLRTYELDSCVKTSIITDVMILEAISKLITIMGTSNQCLVQAPQLNTY